MKTLQIHRTLFGVTLVLQSLTMLQLCLKVYSMSQRWACPVASVATCMFANLPSIIVYSKPAQQPPTFKSFVFCSIFNAIAALAAISRVMSTAHVVDLTLPGVWSLLPLPGVWSLAKSYVRIVTLNMFTTHGPSDPTQVPEQS